MPHGGGALAPGPVLSNPMHIHFAYARIAELGAQQSMPATIASWSASVASMWACAGGAGRSKQPMMGLDYSIRAV